MYSMIYIYIYCVYIYIYIHIYIYRIFIFVALVKSVHPSGNLPGVPRPARAFFARVVGKSPSFSCQALRRTGRTCAKNGSKNVEKLCHAFWKINILYSYDTWYIHICNHYATTLDDEHITVDIHLFKKRTCIYIIHNSYFYQHVNTCETSSKTLPPHLTMHFTRLHGSGVPYPLQSTSTASYKILTCLLDLNLFFLKLQCTQILPLACNAFVFFFEIWDTVYWREISLPSTAGWWSDVRGINESSRCHPSPCGFSRSHRMPIAPTDGANTITHRGRPKKHVSKNQRIVDFASPRIFTQFWFPNKKIKKEQDKDWACFSFLFNMLKLKLWTLKESYVSL